MNSTNAWGRLTEEQKTLLLISHVEWVVAKRTISGTQVDNRSIDALVESRRVIHGSIEKIGKNPTFKQTAADGAWAVLEENRGKNNEKDSYMVPYMCWKILTMAHGWIPPKYDGDLYDIANDFLWPMTDMRHSPLVAWLSSNIEFIEAMLHPGHYGLYS